MQKTVGFRGRKMKIGSVIAGIKRILPAVIAAAFVAGCDTGNTSAFTVYAFSAGAADSFLITTAGSSVLIDCGEKDDGDDISEYLKSRGITHLDYLIITHFDKDHIGGVPAVLDCVRVDKVLQSDQPKDSKTYDRYIDALDDAGIEPETLTDDGDITFEFDGATYTVDAPKGGYSDDESNNSSLMISITYNGSRLLFAGDAEEERLTEYLEEKKENYDFLKVPHHGRSDRMSRDFIETVRPKIAVITSSEDEPEDEEVTDMLKETGAEVFLTRQGPVMTTLTENGLEARYIQ